ncbi:hypothetical protein [Okeania sp. KiyG1]|uniref:hypothetical protein n=1 Tax=Okeania sp. KiyG1 TaxID=2720165 RepID=UPI001920DD61|nr:hypothetical protein [Okeania sp. KiyG1]GGA14115.1 hypothetical protein CYANOKiyG1_27610 [Okeania sp. KiyG1]
MNEGRLNKSLPVASKILISATGTGFYVPVIVPHQLADALKIKTDADLASANKTRVAVPNTAKLYAPRVNTAEADEDEDESKVSNRANTKGMPGTKIKGRRIVGKRFIVVLKTPVDQTIKDEKKSGYIKRVGMRVPAVVSIAAFGTWLSKFADPTEIPVGYYVEKSSRMYTPGDYSDNLTKIDISGP